MAGQAWWIGPAALLLVLGGALVAQRHGLWYDELYTAEVAPIPLADLARAVARGEGTIPYLRDAPPSYGTTYYVVVHAWLALTGLAPDEVGLRLLSLLAATGAVALLARAVARLAGRRAAAAAGLVVAANPLVVEYAAEARSYGLAVLATAATALALARWLDGRPRSLLAFGLAAAAAGLAHWFALLAVASLAVAALVLRGRRALPLGLVAAASALPALGLVGTALANGVGASGAEWIADVGTAVPRLLLRSWAGGLVPLSLLTLAAAAAGLAGVRSAPARPAAVVAGAWALGPVAAVTAVEQVRPVYVDRYLLPACLGLGVLVGLGVARLPRRAGIVLLAALLAASGASTARGLRLGPKEDVRSAVAVVAAGHRSGEPVVAAARWDALGLDHLARRSHPGLVPDLVLPPAAVPAAPVVWVVRRAEGGVQGDEEKLAGLDRDLAGRGLRVVEERSFAGRYAEVLVQRWAVPAA